MPKDRRTELRSCSEFYLREISRVSKYHAGGSRTTQMQRSKVHRIAEYSAGKLATISETRARKVSAIAKLCTTKIRVISEVEARKRIRIRHFVEIDLFERD